MDPAVMELRLNQWMPIFEAQAKSGLNKQDWCEQNGIKRSMFFKWQRECRKYLLAKEQSNTLPAVSEVTAPAFVELSCTDSSVNNRSASATAPHTISSDICLMVSGINITLHGEVDELNLTKVLKAVSHVY